MSMAPKVELGFGVLGGRGISRWQLRVGRGAVAPPRPQAMNGVGAVE
jgi:hypothetical protein